MFRPSKVLRQQVEGNLGSQKLEITLKYGKSLEAFDLVMKLLFGFQDVLIPKEQHIQFLAIIEELDIDTIKGWRQKVREAITERIDESLLFEAYEIGTSLNLPLLTNKCLQVLTSRNFKDIISQKASFNQLSEANFESILDVHDNYQKNGKTSQCLQVKELVLAITDYCQSHYQEETACKNNITKNMVRYLTENGEDVKQNKESISILLSEFLSALLAEFKSILLAEFKNTLPMIRQKASKDMEKFTNDKEQLPDKFRGETVSMGKLFLKESGTQERDNDYGSGNVGKKRKLNSTHELKVSNEIKLGFFDKRDNTQNGDKPSKALGDAQQTRAPESMFAPRRTFGRAMPYELTKSSEFNLQTVASHQVNNADNMVKIEVKHQQERSQCT